MTELAARRKLSDLTAGPVLTWTTEAMLVRAVLKAYASELDYAAGLRLAACSLITQLHFLSFLSCSRLSSHSCRTT